jgi:hypothetical protein
VPDVTNDSFGSEGGDEEVTMSIVTNNWSSSRHCCNVV